ncbi:hypothetical protein CBR_g4518 [Chara braunii]|uniref:Uncharacterized protein n=1 Tax=Chara braunii TaxID=69332 RepID=A0A388KI46_CHABU|nr:hypothetical protein CBR_g4518 [Chara braunii]|eukprot:GBG69688.1 hypothetical protein CBR_g4518 [Chara braunii]
MATSLHEGLRGIPLDLQGEEEVSAFSTVITYKQQLEEMYAVLCQANGELPYDVLLEGEETYDGWDDELYDLISLRQQDATDRAWAIAVFYDCIEMLQLVKDTFADLLARRGAGGFPDTEMRTESIAPASVTTSPTTPFSPTIALAALVSTTTTSSVVNMDKLSISSSAVTAPMTAPITISSLSAPTVFMTATQTEAVRAVLTITTPISTSSLSRGVAPSVNSQTGCACQRELFAQGHAVWGWEEGLPPHVEFADWPRLNASKSCSCKTLEEGQGFGGEFEMRLHENDDDDFADGFCASSITVAHAARSDDIFHDKNNKKCDTAYDDQISNNNKIAVDIRDHVSVICLAFISPPFRFFVRNDQGREGWGIVMFCEQEGPAGRGEVGWRREGVG